MLRTITSHIANPVNDQLKIQVVDAPGAGGASHRYEITGFDGIKNPSKDAGNVSVELDEIIILFQNGPINEHGINGITQEVLLAIVIDRLESFQNGPFPSAYNATALHHARLALETLKDRTRERMARGVEGQTKA